MGLEQVLGRGWPWRRKETAQSPGASHMERAAQEGPRDASPIPQGGGLKRAVFPPTPRPRVCLPLSDLVEASTGTTPSLWGCRVQGLGPACLEAHGFRSPLSMRGWDMGGTWSCVTALPALPAP